MKVIKQFWDLLAWLGPSVWQVTKKVSSSQVLLLIMLYISVTVLGSLVCCLELEQRQSGHVWPLFLQISNTGHSCLWHKHQWFQQWACRSRLFLSLTKIGSHQIFFIFSFSVKFISRTIRLHLLLSIGLSHHLPWTATLSNSLECLEQQVYSYALSLQTPCSQMSAI